MLRAGCISEAFFADNEERANHDMPLSDEPMFVVVELNLFHEKGLSGARERLSDLCKDLSVEERHSFPSRTPMFAAG